MTTDWLETESAVSLTRDQVAAAGLPAWSTPADAGAAAFSFDGRRFLRHALRGDPHPVAARRGPRERLAPPRRVSLPALQADCGRGARLLMSGQSGDSSGLEAGWVPVDDLLARLAPAQSRRRLSSVDVLASGEPALFDDFGERLLYADGRLIDLVAARRSSEGALLAPLLPASIIETGVGLEFGWRHAAACRLRRVRARHSQPRARP